MRVAVAESEHDSPVMISHQTVGVANPIEISDYSFQRFQKLHPIRIILIDGFPSVTSGSDMKERAVELNPHRSSHTQESSQNEASFLDMTLGRHRETCRSTSAIATDPRMPGLLRR